MRQPVLPAPARLRQRSRIPYVRLHAAVRCLRWQYDSGSTHAVFFFEPASERLLAVFTREDGIGGAIDASDQVKSLLHASRNTGEP